MAADGEDSPYIRALRAVRTSHSDVGTIQSPDTFCAPGDLELSVYGVGAPAGLVVSFFFPLALPAFTSTSVADIV